MAPATLTDAHPQNNDPLACTEEIDDEDKENNHTFDRFTIVPFNSPTSHPSIADLAVSLSEQAVLNEMRARQHPVRERFGNAVRIREAERLLKRHMQEKRIQQVIETCHSLHYSRTLEALIDACRLQLLQ